MVKSTVPVGFCERMTQEHGRLVLFSPEFLREGHALHDNLYPSRIIVGDAGRGGQDRSRTCCWAAPTDRTPRS